MKTKSKLIAVGIRAAALAVVLGLSVPAFAHAEGGTSSGSGSGGTSSTTIAEDSTSGSTKTTDRSLSESHARDLTEQFKKQGLDSNTSDRAKRPEHSEEFRQKACEARKAEVTKRMANSVTKATKFKAKMDAFYAKVKKFHDDKALTTPDYDALVAKVDAASTKADESIAALKALDVSIDCTKTNVADQLSAFRAAVKATRGSLKDYRSALVELSKAVHQSAETESTSTQNNTTSN